MVTGGPTGLSDAAVGTIVRTSGVEAVNPVVVSQMIVSFVQLGDPTSEQYPIQGIDPAALGTTMDLGVVSGTLDDVTDDHTIALSSDAALATGAQLGDSVTGHLGDGAVITATVVATYTRGLGFGDVTMTNAALRAHTTSGLSDYALVSTEPGMSASVQASLEAAGFTVLDHRELRAAGDGAREANSLVNLIALAVILGYIAIAVVNTLVLATGERRREFALMQFVGSTRRQVRAMMRIESLVAVVLAAVLGVLVAAAPLIGISVGISGQPLPNISLIESAAIVGSLSIIGVIALALATRGVMRSAPLTEIGSRQ
jgi:putative ABC transport system permease protein